MRICPIFLTSFEKRAFNYPGKRPQTLQRYPKAISAVDHSLSMMDFAEIARHRLGIVQTHLQLPRLAVNLCHASPISASCLLVIGGMIMDVQVVSAFLALLVCSAPWS